MEAVKKYIQYKMNLRIPVKYGEYCVYNNFEFFRMLRRIRR